MSQRPTDTQIIEACKAWGTNLSFPSTPSDFSSLYTANGTHTDHCHFYRQNGTAELEILHRVWLNSLRDCVMSVDKIDILQDTPSGNRRAHIWYTGSGYFANDLNLTKANGQYVKYLGTVAFEFDENGKIISGDEWMSNIFYKQPVMSYRVLWEPTA